MRPFHFGLERLLKVKRQREREAGLLQQQARQALEAARSRVAALEAELARAAATWQGNLGQALPAGGWVTAHAHSTRLGQLLLAGEAEQARAVRAFEEASARWTRIATEVEALLYLRRQAWNAYHVEALRQEQDRLDELSLRRWTARQRRGHASGAGPEGEVP